MKNRVIIFDFNRTLYDPDAQKPAEGALELLEDARAKGYVLLLMSKAGPGRAQQVKDLGIAEYFAEMVFDEQKSRELFEDLAGRHEADRAASFVIGDRAQGELKLGHEGGWRTIWVRAGKFADELPAADQPPDFVVASLRDIPTII